MVARNRVLSAVYSADKENPLAQMIQHLVEVRDAPVGWYMLDDLLAGRVPDSVKMFIFADTFVVGRDDAFALLDRLDQRPGCMAVWFYAPGYVDPVHLPGEAGTGIAFAERLTGGIRPQLLASPLRDWLQPVAHGLTAGVPPFGTTRTDLRPQFHIAPGLPGVETLCTYADDPGKIAAAILPAASGRGWDSVYLCSPTICPELLANLAARAGLLPASGFNDASLPGWIAGPGSWQASAGLLRQSATNATTFTGFGGHAGADFSLQADVQLSGSGWAGVSFRKANPSDSPFASGYLVHLRQNGWVTLYKPGGAIAGAASGGDPVNGFVRLRVEALGPDIVVHANGKPIISIADGTYAAGYAGFATSVDASARFDRFRIDATSVDMDADGLPNEWELEWFGAPVTAAASADADTDGFPNLDEYIAGTDPLDAMSLFKVALSDAAMLEWNAVTGRTYRVWRTPDLRTPFELAEEGIDFPRNSWNDTTNPPACFYRLEVGLKEAQ